MTGAPPLLAAAQLATPIALPATTAAAQGCVKHTDQAGRGREARSGTGRPP
jgi:hypothetical protein